LKYPLQFPKNHRVFAFGVSVVTVSNIN
jgi:hypothetical protein